MAGMLGSVITTQTVLAIALVAVLQEQIYGVALQYLFPIVTLYALSTFRLSNPKAGFLRSLTACFLISFADTFVTSLFTQKPLPDVFYIMLVEYFVLYGLSRLVSQHFLLKALGQDAVRGALFLIVGFIKCYAMVKVLHPILSNDFSTHSIVMSMTTGIAKMAAPAFASFLDLLIVSRLERVDPSAVTRVSTIALGLVSVVIGTLYLLLFLAEEEYKTRSHVLTNVVGCVPFLIFYGYEAKRYGKFFQKFD